MTILPRSMDFAGTNLFLFGVPAPVFNHTVCIVDCAKPVSYTQVSTCILH